MGKSNTATSVVDTSAITARVLPVQPRIHVLDNGREQTILLQESLGEIPFPSQLRVTGASVEKDVAAAGVVILPLSGGGRGPVINNGQVIDLSLLLDLLANALSEGHLSPELNARLDSIPLLVPNSKSQSGYATHNDVIVLDHDWSGRPPKIELNLSHGQLVKRIETVTGVDPNIITYVEIPDQEILYGHTGVVNDNQFTVKAAILEKSAPTIVALVWTPADVVGPPVTALTTLSPITNTALPCMGLRIQGTLGLTNSAAYEVAGSMYAQISVDGGPWVNIAEFYWHFDAGEVVPVSEKFDVIMAYDQTAHTYQFRGKLVVDSDEEINRRLTGAIHIATVAEIGTGNVLSNDLQLKWACKE